jgi:transcriptional regulator with XRE-family HTH domain
VATVRRHCLAMTLKEYKDANGLTYRKLALLLKYDSAQVCRWVLGHRYPSVKQAFDIEKKTGGMVLAASFLGGDGDE